MPGPPPLSWGGLQEQGGAGAGRVRAEKFCTALPASQPWLLAPKHFTCLNVKLNLKNQSAK